MVRSPSTCGRRGPRAFTLIELLTVVGIIALLGALLLPALHKAKAVAYRGGCQHNLRQLGVALHLYTSDYGYFPTALDLDVRSWKYVLGTLVGEDGWNIGPRSVFQCPAKTGLRDATRTFGYNGFGFGWDQGLFGTLQPDRYLPARDSDVLAPANMIALGDCFTKTLDGQILAQGELLLRTEQVVSAKPEVIAFWAKAAALRHGNRANIVFCDGHVELIPNRILFLDNGDDALRRWNRDNQPHRPGN